MGEFDFIGRHFKPLAGPGSYGLRNDGAVMSAPFGHEIVVSSDTMVENVHFLPDDPPETVGRKLLRCNLSDLAAMDAKPLGYTLNSSIPHKGGPEGRYGEAWFAAFAKGLAEDQQRYAITLLGGDTTSTSGPLVMTLTIFGTVAEHKALTRSGASAGDSVWVTGHLGAARLGLEVRRGHLEDPTGKLVQAYRLPTPRVGLQLGTVASAGLDISDGIVQDAGHIAEESGVRLRLEASRLPIAAEAAAAPEHFQEMRLLGGDDYELLLTCPPGHEAALMARGLIMNVPLTRIGKVEALKKGEKPGVVMVGADGKPLSFTTPGWQHF
ncbi:thiamine-phosphate kinase [Formicincola oecophyllae]|uniref:Thiamine-monophosphate kinase n=1 Tax=Formicincola oecophyllae TaxID=2558361 RepID=A0A4Y6U9U6_9PROT|nr:thiamine-phosphate kinase [Formicincola oecophyllae]QDH14223.1 thiamine-phosphate kinase [Formicincola oecophyllae]